MQQPHHLAGGARYPLVDRVVEAAVGLGDEGEARMDGTERAEFVDRAVAGRAVDDDVLELDAALGVGGLERPPDRPRRVAADRDERYLHCHGAIPQSMSSSASAASFASDAASSAERMVTTFSQKERPFDFADSNIPRMTLAAAGAQEPFSTKPTVRRW